MPTITVKYLNAARPQANEYKITVDRGLYLRVAPDGAKTWLVRYSVDRQQRQLRLAKPYGVGEGFLTLADARAENARLQAIARGGTDPREEANRRKAQEAARIETEKASAATFRDMFDAWARDGVRRSDGNAEIKRSFEKDVLPALAHKPVKSLTEHDLRAALRAMVARGVNRMAVRVYRDIRQLFGWAERRQPWRSLMADGNPADLVEIEKVVSPDYDMSEERDRVLCPDQIRELRDIFAAMDRDYECAGNKRRAVRPLLPQSQLALWICLGTLCRIGELLMAEWAHVDLDRGEWFVPKENVKGARGKKQDHLVFLSPFALQHFKALNALTGSSRWRFPGRSADRAGGAVADGNRDLDAGVHVHVKTISKQVGDRQTQFKARKPLQKRRHDNTLVLSSGRDGEWTPHDLRRTGATMMQGLGVLPDVIDRCQNHVLKGSKIRRHYLHHDYAAEKRDAWNRLGAEIESILAVCQRPVERQERSPRTSRDRARTPERKASHDRPNSS
jgi:integrase